MLIPWRWSFESQCPSSTESFCEQLHKRALKPILPGGKVEPGEWGEVDYPHLWQYKIPPQVSCRVTGAGNLLSHEDPLTSDSSKVFSLQVSPFCDTFTSLYVILKYSPVANSYISLQHCSMASVGALLMFLPVAWTCSPQKAGNVTMVERWDGTWCNPWHTKVNFIYNFCLQNPKNVPEDFTVCAKHDTLYPQTSVNFTKTL